MLPPGMRCVIVHSLVDQFSNPGTHAPYWSTLVNTQYGAGPNDKSKNLLIATKRDTHAGLAPFQEGLSFKSQAQIIEFNEVYEWLLDF